MSDGPNRGSTFTVTLPLPMLRTVTSFKTQTSSTAGEQKKLFKIHVLLVEDEAETRSALATVLRAAGATVAAVGSAGAAVESYRSAKVDLMISDIGMPGEDGYSLIRQIRSLEAKKGTNRTPALALTAFVSEEDQRKALAAGFDRHLGKPVEPSQLLSVLAEMLASREG